MMPAVPGRAGDTLTGLERGKQPPALQSLSPTVSPQEERENCLRNQMQDEAFMDMESLWAGGRTCQQQGKPVGCPLCSPGGVAGEEKQQQP